MSRHILLVDDDLLSLSILGTGLRHAGYTVVEAASGEAALACAQIQPPDLAILDIQMPGMSGIELARHLRETHRVPVLFLSGHSGKEMVQNAINAGGLGYMVKPVDVPQLVPMIEAAIARSQDLQALKALSKAKGPLKEALQGESDTTVAIAILMERHGLLRKQALDLLRARAQTRRIRMEALARDIIDATELLNSFQIKE